MTSTRLHTFRSSHFNEKALWALDQAGVAPERIEYLPGFHARALRGLSGLTQTPVMEFAGEVVAGSSAIVDALDRAIDAPPLQPEDPAEREACDEWIRWFDDEVGPGIRAALFQEILVEPAYAALLFAPGGRIRDRAFRGAFPRIAGVMRSKMGIDAASAKRGCEVTDEAFTRVAEASRETGYLVADRFTAADLTAAALLSVALYPAGFHAPLPEPVSSSMRGWIARWSDHPGAQWVRDIYARHRRAHR